MPVPPALWERCHSGFGPSVLVPEPSSLKRVRFATSAVCGSICTRTGWPEVTVQAASPAKVTATKSVVFGNGFRRPTMRFYSTSILNTSPSNVDAQTEPPPTARES